MKNAIREWLTWHSLSSHLVAPLWLRVPEKWRWRIVHRLDRSRRRCWAELVDAALAHPGADACDVRTPLGCGAGTCPTRCDWSHPDHAGQHECSCYCGKFQFTAAAGSIERRAAVR